MQGNMIHHSVAVSLLLCCVASLICASESTPRSLSAPDNSYINDYRYDNQHAFAGISVPFFLYSGGDFDVFWNACRKPIFAKGVEVSFLLHLQNHPWRTYDPEEAAVFVIPGLFSVALNVHPDQPDNCKLSVEEMSAILAGAVRKSPWFNRFEGRDHLMAIGYYKAEYFLRGAFEWRGLLNHTTFALHSGSRSYIGQDIPRCIISVGHHASPILNSDMEVKTSEDLVHMRPLKQGLLDKQADNSLKPQRRAIFMLGQANKLRYYRHRVIAVKKLINIGENSFIAASMCEKEMELKPCRINRKKKANDAGVIADARSFPIAPVTNCCLKVKLSYTSFLKHMMMSNFSLLIGGGDPGSSRFADALALSVPQIVLSDGFYSRYAPFPCTVPWREITEQIVEKDFEREPERATQEALDRATPRRESMIRLQQKYARDVDWTHPHTLAPNNLLVETVRKCFPRELKGTSSVVDRVMKQTHNMKCFENTFVARGSDSDGSKRKMKKKSGFRIAHKI